MTSVETIPFISLHEAAFGYGGKKIIEDVTLEVMRGEFIGLIGPNGAGKSTLFKGLLKLIPPMKGTVHHSPLIFKKIGYVPQRDQLDAIYPLSAFAVAKMGATGILPWHKLFDPTIETRVMESLRRVGMWSHRDHAFSDLSGGQRQRVLIARALAMNPEMLVLDEPTAGIDPVAEESILKLLTDLHKSQNITILMVSHNIPSLRHHVQRAVLVKNHRVMAGPASELLDPLKIAELLGSSL